MKSRVKYWLSALAVVAVATITTTASISTDFRLGQNVELVVGMMRNLYLYYVDPLDPDELGKGAAAGMVAALDPYTELIHADESDDFELATTGRYGGIGSIIRQRGEWVRIAEPYEGSPADRAGLEIGDTFLEIEGKSAHNMTTAQVSAALKGDPGTAVTIKVRKLLTGDIQTLTIRREVISLPAVPYHSMVADSVGYILHTEFTEGSADEVRAALDALRRHGATKLVIDLRGNGGGIMQEAVKIAGMFTPRGTEVVSMRGRGEGTSKSYVTPTEPLEPSMPLVLLVDGYSASAAEIVAGAMQDLDRGVVIGQRTYGKGLVQSTLPLGFGSYVKLTTAKYYIPSGRCIQAIDYSRVDDSLGLAPRQRAIPDSLIREFRTAGGRRVYDGGGVMPDIRLEADYSSRFAYVVYSRGLIDDFADEWRATNAASAARPRPVEPREFALTDADWAAFTAFVTAPEHADKLRYESATGRTLEHLRSAAESERYLTPGITAAIDSLAAALKDDPATNLEIHRAELTGLITDAIILRHHYARGVTAHNLASDPAVARAMELLGDAGEYRTILTTRDTDRK